MTERLAEVLREENLDSISLSSQQQLLLDEHNRQEEPEDKLKEYIASYIPTAPILWKAVLQRILDIILKIDEAQDKHIETILRHSHAITVINRASNGLLKPYDPLRKFDPYQLQLFKRRLAA